MCVNVALMLEWMKKKEFEEGLESADVLISVFIDNSENHKLLRHSVAWVTHYLLPSCCHKASL